MGQVVHRSATTTEAIRRTIQQSQESMRALARRHGINQKTVAITQYPGDDSCFLMHICADGSVADKELESIADAIEHAEWELGVVPAERIGVDEPW